MSTKLVWWCEKAGLADKQTSIPQLCISLDHPDRYSCGERLLIDEPDYHKARKLLLEWFPCACHEAYTRRGLQSPDCLTHDLEDLLPLLIDAALGKEER